MGRCLVVLFGWLCAISLVKLPASAQPSEQRLTLPNGLRVVIAPDPDQSQVCVLVRYAVGNRDDPPGYRGLAHLTEHMTYRVGATLSQLESLGATHFNGITTADETYYYAVLPPASLQSVLWLEARRLAFSAASMGRKELKLEQRIVLREWSDNYDNEGSALQSELAEEIYPRDHPYARRTDRPNDVQAASLADVQWFTQAHYRPENAALTITGKFDPEEALVWVQRYFEPVRSTGRAPARKVSAQANLDRVVTVERSANVAHELLILTWLLPGYDSKALPALELGARLLSAQLRARLVEPDGPASSAEAFIEKNELQSLFTIAVVARDQARAKDLSPQVGEAISELTRRPIDETALEQARAGADRALFSLARDPVQTSLLLARGFRPDSDMYMNLTAAQVQEALRAWLPAGRRAVGSVTRDKR